ncbi:MAG: hypothetical protein ACT4P4_19945 [Betaproteobacteria bacterium]
MTIRSMPPLMPFAGAAPPSWLRALAAEAVSLRLYIVAAAATIALSYSTYLVFDASAMIALGREDGVFESLTVVFFLIASALFFVTWRRSGNVFFLLLSFALFVGAGEEISWGQRLIGFATPSAVAATNVQNEFNVHNLAVLNATDMRGQYKQGLAKLLTVNFLYKLFWLGFGVLIPLAARASAVADAVLRRWRFPLAALPIGLLFLVNWLGYRFTFSLLHPGENMHYYAAAMEIQESLSAMVFMMLGFWFLKEELRKPA